MSGYRARVLSDGSGEHLIDAHDDAAARMALAAVRRHSKSRGAVRTDINEGMEEIAADAFTLLGQFGATGVRQSHRLDRPTRRQHQQSMPGRPLQRNSLVCVRVVT